MSTIRDYGSNAKLMALMRKVGMPTTLFHNLMTDAGKDGHITRDQFISYFQRNEEVKPI